MGGLISLTSKEGEDVSSAALIMLETINHRGLDASGIASPSTRIMGKSVEDLRRKPICSDSLIGYNFAKILPRDAPQPLHVSGASIVFDGRIFPYPKKREVEHFIEAAKNYEEKDLIHFIQASNGGYIFAIAKDDRILAGRDSIGTYPLCYGENKRLYAIASERKALWRIGIKHTREFPPGRLAIIDREGFHFKVGRLITQPPLQRLTVEGACQLFKPILIQSIERHVEDIQEIAVAFSGGLDSSLLAWLAKEKVDVNLLSVGLEGQKENVFVERAAKALGLPLHQVIYTLKDVERVLPKVVWLTEEPNVVTASIGIPIFWVAQISAKLDLPVLMLGQGADELFGGYHRYLQYYRESGLDYLRDQITRDVASSHRTNFQRDNKICSFHKVDLRLPYADYTLVQTALSYPVNIKIASPIDALRKTLLRYTARDLDLPKFISERPKKAIQYSTGVSKAIGQLAKKQDLTRRELVEQIFLDTCYVGVSDG